jgi:hypothetical protein
LVSDRLVLGGLALAIVVLLAAIVVAAVTYANPAVPALSLPTTSSR